MLETIEKVDNGITVTFAVFEKDDLEQGILQ